MFRCDFCENYFDKSECEENPKDDTGNICYECLATWEEEHPKRPPGFDIEAWAASIESEREAEYMIRTSYFEGQASNNYPSDLPTVCLTLEDWKYDYMDWDSDHDEMRLEFPTWEAFKEVLEEVEE